MRARNGPTRSEGRGRAVACDDLHGEDPGGPSLASIRWDRAHSATTVSVHRSKGVGPVAMTVKLLFWGASVVEYGLHLPLSFRTRTRTRQRDLEKYMTRENR